MKKRKRQKQEVPSTPGTEPDPADDERWDSPGFRNKILLSVAFVAAPALVMALLGVHWMAGLWFGIGVLIIVWDGWRQVRDLWRWLIGKAGQ